MNFYIPDIKDQITLEENWKFTVISDYRNMKFLTAFKDAKTVTIPANTTLIVDRVYIRKGNSDYSSLTFIIKDFHGDKTKNKLRFFASLSDINKMRLKCIVNNKTGDVIGTPPEHIAQNSAKKKQKIDDKKLNSNLNDLALKQAPLLLCQEQLSDLSVQNVVECANMIIGDLVKAFNALKSPQYDLRPSEIHSMLQEITFNAVMTRLSGQCYYKIKSQSQTTNNEYTRVVVLDYMMFVDYIISKCVFHYKVAEEIKNDVHSNPLFRAIRTPVLTMTFGKDLNLLNYTIKIV